MMFYRCPELIQLRQINVDFDFWPVVIGSTLIPGTDTINTKTSCECIDRGYVHTLYDVFILYVC